MSSPTKARMSENSPPNLGIRLAKTTPTTTIWQLLVILFRKYMTSHGPRTLHEGPATPTKWKSESVTELPMNLLIWEGAK